MVSNHQPAFIRWLKSLGPGLITAALVFGPSKLTIASKLGASYGYSLLWMVLVAIFFMAIFVSMSTRIGIATNKSLLSSVRQKWGSYASIAMGIGVFLVTASFQAGNSIGVGLAAGEMFHTLPAIWIVLFSAIGIGLLFFKSFYKILESVMILLILMMLFSFLTTLFYAGPHLPDVAVGFITPTIPAGSQGLMIAFVASCFSIVGALYQSYLVQERIRGNPELRYSKIDSVTGVILLGFMCSVVIICAASVLNPKGISINSASDMAKALEPIFGSKASNVFLIGLFGAAFSSLIGNASVGGTLLGDAFGLGGNFNSKGVRILVAVVMIIGAVIAIRFGKLPLELIVFAQSVTILIVPFIGIAMYLVGNDKEIMGDKVNSTFVKIAGALGLIIVLGLALINCKELINNPLFH